VFISPGVNNGGLMTTMSACLRNSTHSISAEVAAGIRVVAFDGDAVGVVLLEKEFDVVDVGRAVVVLVGPSPSSPIGTLASPVLHDATTCDIGRSGTNEIQTRR
jgi:hypothetical protein